jgi:xanthine dehydrogenase accessory factor
MDRLLEELVTRCGRGECVALCTVVATRGSTPQASGARMLLLGDGRTIGTLGGGCVEAEVRRRAIELLSTSTSMLLTFRLDHDYGWDDGLICGGTMDIFVEVIGTGEVARFERVAQQLRNGQPASLEIRYTTDGVERVYSETLEPAARLVIAGAGHVGQALAAIATGLGFDITVIDDRADYASIERFPLAKQHIIGDIETELSRLAVDERSYIVIVTRGHRNDGRALAAVVNSGARYVGLIGSKRKIKTIFDDLVADGVPIEALCRVHAPVGLEIGAVTVPEIAVSIAAELVAVRRGRGGVAAAPMKFDGQRLGEMLSKRSPAPS